MRRNNLMKKRMSHPCISKALGVHVKENTRLGATLRYSMENNVHVQRTYGISITKPTINQSSMTRVGVSNLISSVKFDSFNQIDENFTHFKLLLKGSLKFWLDLMVTFPRNNYLTCQIPSLIIFTITHCSIKSTSQFYCNQFHHHKHNNNI